MEIRAYAALSRGKKLESFSYPEPLLGPHEILIQITHCGLCHSDLHLIDDDWKKSIYPLVPGHEVVGLIAKKGSEVSLPLGSRVGVSWYLSSCLKCPYCLSAETQNCPEKKATCIGHYGGFANYLTADSRFVHLIPEKLDSAIAAPLLCAGATVYTPFRRWKIQAPARVAIIGIGGLGHLALQFARAFGCSKVTAISSSNRKREEALRFGANAFISLEDLKKNPASHALSYDFILSTVTVDIDWNFICSLLTYSGILCLVGRPPGPLNLNLLTSLSTNRIITGSTVANRFFLNEMLQFAADHGIAPQIERMALSQVNEAIERLRQNQAHYRIVLESV